MKSAVSRIILILIFPETDLSINKDAFEEHGNCMSNVKFKSMSSIFNSLGTAKKSA